MDETYPCNTIVPGGLIKSIHCFAGTDMCSDEVWNTGNLVGALAGQRIKTFNTAGLNSAKLAAFISMVGKLPDVYPLCGPDGSGYALSLSPGTRGEASPGEPLSACRSGYLFILCRTRNLIWSVGIGMVVFRVLYGEDLRSHISDLK